MWRGGLSERRTAPLGREAAPKPASAVYQEYRMQWFRDCCAAERG
ncbi:hypothetical protein PMI27_001882 [Pseudomonas sp. GM41(2012)]|nr:hypothetical protein PMI27_001882 [Pseudomonas sp. GM41(2012)]